MEARLVAAVVARGGTLRVADGRLACRLPAGETLPEGLAAAIAANKDTLLGALGVADAEATVRHILGMDDGELAAYRAALAHDLAALAEAEARLADRDQGGAAR